MRILYGIYNYFRQRFSPSKSPKKELSSKNKVSGKLEGQNEDPKVVALKRQSEDESETKVKSYFSLKFKRISMDYFLSNLKSVLFL